MNKKINILLYVPLVLFSTILIASMVPAVYEMYPAGVFYGIVLGVIVLSLIALDTLQKAETRGTDGEAQTGPSSSAAVVWNLVVMCAQIPPFFFVSRFSGRSLLQPSPVGAMAFWFYVFGIAAIIMSGLVARIAITGLIRDGRIEKGSSALLSVGSFILGINVITAIGLVIYNSRKPESEA